MCAYINNVIIYKIQIWLIRICNKVTGYDVAPLVLVCSLTRNLDVQDAR